MMTVGWNIDPEGDVLLLLDTGNTVIGDSQSLTVVKLGYGEDAPAANDECALKEESEKEKQPDDVEMSESSESSESVRTEDLDDDFPHSVSDCPTDDYDEEDDGELPPAHRTRNVIFRVSSKHLTLASPVFDPLVRVQFREAAALSKSGPVKIHLPDDDPDGMLYLLKAVHGKFRQMTGEMTPRFLMQIVLLADKYELHESIEPFADKWFKAVKHTMPTVMHPDLMHWIALCRELNRPEEFKKLTCIALYEGPLDSSSEILAISGIVDALAVLKTDLLSTAFAELHELVETYWCRSGGVYRLRSRSAKPPVCDFEDPDCDDAVLGFLLAGLRRQNLHPFPKRPYDNVEIKDVASGLAGIKIASLCHRTDGDGFAHCSDRVNNKLDAIAEQLIAGSNVGLDLKDWRKDRKYWCVEVQGIWPGY